MDVRRENDDAVRRAFRRGACREASPAATEPQRTLARPWATLTPMSFEPDDLARIRDAEEIEIETQAPDGPAHRTTIWIMVEADDTFVRSVRGATGRWFVEATANPAVAIHVDGRRIAATAIPASDPDSIDRINRALTAKYTGIEGYDSMLEPDALPTNFRLEPA